ncbi:SDR family oxidoreductase [Natronorubrum sp. JWXQ-INN-674]|uniref:SDR family oxidoreductase n=1 Tax=Natronorubrum halalkaliphilum TaxID=2691917 RepID=A0A6B0VME8_9EURY|nr:SDR family oxidoreductase [Natronorubrum halalkaliphilum]MXV63011.1 SDR family oxidoreductase [Natronorubrum halalkaliphilum]
MLQGTVAFVTGASRGIGRQIAIELADAGAKVALAARSDEVEETAKIIDAPERTLPIRVDVTEEETIRAGIESTVDEFGSLDCVVNNAGIPGPSAPAEEITRENWEETLAVNTTGVFLVSKHAIPHLKESDQGRIVNISSITGKRPRPERTPYAASKMAVVGLGRTLAAELGESGITVNTVCPGATETPRIDRFVSEYAQEEGITTAEAKRELFTDRNQLGALPKPEDTAELVVFLASEKGAHITAQDINVDSGTIWY